MYWMYEALGAPFEGPFGFIRAQRRFGEQNCHSIVKTRMSPIALSTYERLPKARGFPPDPSAACLLVSE
jgi:hypothetical protein